MDVDPEERTNIIGHVQVMCVCVQYSLHTKERASTIDYVALCFSVIPCNFKTVYHVDEKCHILCCILKCKVEA